MLYELVLTFRKNWVASPEFAFADFELECDDAEYIVVCLQPLNRFGQQRNPLCKLYLIKLCCIFMFDDRKFLILQTYLSLKTDPYAIL